MKNCKNLLEALKGGDQAVREVVRAMYQDEQFRKSALGVHQKYGKLRPVIDWEDILSEAIARFMEKVYSGEEIRNCNSYFYGICDRYCLELLRKLRTVDPPPPTPFVDIDLLMDRLEPYILRLSPKCRFILHWLLFNPSPLKPPQRKELSELLKKQGYDVQPSSISSEKTRCIKNLRGFVGENLDEFFDQE